MSASEMSKTKCKIRLLSDLDLPALMELYHLLHPEDPVLSTSEANKIWLQIKGSQSFYYYGAEIEGKLVASCTISIIPNLTRGGCPYGIIENVITHPSYRNQGVGTQMLRMVMSFGWYNNCYKIMLLSGSKNEKTLRFYQKVGFERGMKTGFVAFPKYKV